MGAIKLTQRERLSRVFRREAVDRMPVRLWGVDPMFPRKGWEPLYRLVEDYDLEIIRSWSPLPEEVPPLKCGVENWVNSRGEGGAEETTTTINTPLGALTRISARPSGSSSGRTKKYYIENVADAGKWLSILPPDFYPKFDSYRLMEKNTGGRALLKVDIDEAMFCVNRLLGSELFGYWLYDHRELLRRMVEKAFKEIEALLKHYLAAGIGDVYGWVGPELCIPPLASAADFREFVFDYDKKLIDLIHEAGKQVWIHCHGDMAPVLTDFIQMGCDCLNPVEPPPVSKITLSEAKKICAGRMTLEGNIQDSAFDVMTPSEIKNLVEEAVAEGKPGGCFILCPTSSPDTHKELLPRHIVNYRAFAETAARLRAY